MYDNYQSVEKFQGMAEAMRNRGLELNDDYIKWCISDEAHNESYVRSIERFLKSIPKCTAIVCCNYIIYRLVMKTLQKMGKTVPEDYSLVCFDYSEETYRHASGMSSKSNSSTRFWTKSSKTSRQALL